MTVFDQEVSGDIKDIRRNHGTIGGGSGRRRQEPAGVYCDCKYAGGIFWGTSRQLLGYKIRHHSRRFLAKLTRTRATPHGGHYDTRKE